MTARFASVYIMEAPDGTYKVGRSIAPDRRTKTLGVWQRLRVVHTSPNTTLAAKIEGICHILLKDKEVPGKREFFMTTLDGVKEALARAERIATGVEPPLPQSVPRYILLDPVRILAIRRYRFQHELLSDAEAIRQLLDVGLETAHQKEREPKRGARK